VHKVHMIPTWASGVSVLLPTASSKDMPRVQKPGTGRTMYRCSCSGVETMRLLCLGPLPADDGEPPPGRTRPLASPGGWGVTGGDATGFAPLCSVKYKTQHHNRSPNGGAYRCHAEIFACMITALYTTEMRETDEMPCHTSTCRC
jgi:hypothetical protein